MMALFIFAQSALASEVEITVYPTLGGAGVAISGGRKITKKRSAILTISSTGLLMWAVGKGVADAHAHSGDAAFIKTGNWWHVASLAQATGAAIAGGALAYGVGSKQLTAWEAVRFGAGDLMRKNVLFRAVYTGVRFGEPCSLKPEYNQHLFYVPGFHGETAIGASHWSHVAAYYAGQYYVGGWLKRNVTSGRSFLYPLAKE